MLLSLASPVSLKTKIVKNSHKGIIFSTWTKGVSVWNLSKLTSPIAPTWWFYEISKYMEFNRNIKSPFFSKPRQWEA